MDKSILRDLSYGMYVVTTKDNNKLYGCIANSIMQINSNTIAISLNKENDTTKAILDSKKLAISILSNDTNIELIKTFGFQKSSTFDKFASTSYELIDELPIIKNTCGYITGNIINNYEVNTHLIILIEIKSMQKTDEITPMTYSYYQNNLKGQTNKNAPTYQENKNTKKHAFKCTICGYVYETDEEELPDDFICPMCKVGKTYFEKLY